MGSCCKHGEPSLGLWDDLEGWDGGGGREARERGNIHILKTEPHSYTAETNTTLESNYPLIKNKFKNNN